MDLTRVRRYEPGRAEFVVALLTIKGKMCPHNPKIRSYTQTTVPSCLAFFYQDSTVILLLKTSSLCKACYDKAVPDGFLVHASSIQQSVDGQPSAQDDGVQWWQFRPLGFESSVPLDIIRLPLKISSEEHRALQPFLGQARPFYLPFFHTMGRIVLKSLIDTDNAIASTYGVPLVNAISGRVAGYPGKNLGTSTAMVASFEGRDKELRCDFDHGIMKEDKSLMKERSTERSKSPGGRGQGASIAQSSLRCDKTDAYNPRLRNGEAQANKTSPSNALYSQGLKPQPRVPQRETHVEQQCGAASGLNTDKHATGEICMNPAATQGSSKSLPGLQQVNHNLDNVPRAQNNPTSALHTSITSTPNQKGPDLKTTATFKNIGPATLLKEPGNDRHSTGMIQRTIGKAIQEQTPINTTPPPHNQKPAIMAKLPEALTQSSHSAETSKSATKSPLSAILPDRKPQIPNKSPVTSFLSPTQNPSRVTLLPNQPPHIKPSHDPTQPIGLNPTREKQQPHNSIINNINLTPHVATTIRPQSLGTSSVSQQSLHEAYKPHTSNGYLKSRMPATAVKPRGPSLGLVSQPHVPKTEGLINQQQGSALLARVSGRLEAALPLRAQVSGGIEITPHMRARVVPWAADPNVLRRDLPGRQTHNVGISQPGVRVKTSNIPLQSRNISSQSPTGGMTGLTTTSSPLHMNSLSDSSLRDDVHPSGSGHQILYHRVHHHLPTRPITSQIGNARTRPIEPNAFLHPDPSKEFSGLNSQGRSSERDPIKIHSAKPGLVKPDSVQHRQCDTDISDQSKKAAALGTGEASAVGLDELLLPSSSDNEYHDSSHQLTGTEGGKDRSVAYGNSDERSNANAPNFDADQAHANEMIVEDDFGKHQDPGEVLAQDGEGVDETFDANIETHHEENSSHEEPAFLQDDQKTTAEELSPDQEIENSFDHQNDTLASEEYQSSIDMKSNYPLLDPGNLDLLGPENSYTNTETHDETSHHPSTGKFDEESEWDSRDLHFKDGDQIRSTDDDDLENENHFDPGYYINTDEFQNEAHDERNNDEMHQYENPGNNYDNVEESFHDSNVKAVDSDEMKDCDRDQLDDNHDDGRDENDNNEHIDSSENYQEHDLVDDHENHCGHEDNPDENPDTDYKNGHENIGDHGNDYDEDQGNEYNEDHGNNYAQDYGHVDGEDHGNVYNEDYWNDYSEDNGNEYYEDHGNDYHEEHSNDYNDVKADLSEKEYANSYDDDQPWNDNDFKDHQTYDNNEDHASLYEDNQAPDVDLGQMHSYGDEHRNTGEGEPLYDYH